MPLIVAERNAIADFEAARLGFVSVHTADPGATGAAEAVGGTYARVALVFPAAVAGVATAAEVTVNVPAGAYTHGGTWTLGAGGVFKGGNPLGAVQTLAAPGQIKVTVTLPVTAT